MEIILSPPVTNNLRRKDYSLTKKVGLCMLRFLLLPPDTPILLPFVVVVNLCINYLYKRNEPFDINTVFCERYFFKKNKMRRAAWLGLFFFSVMSFYIIVYIYSFITFNNFFLYAHQPSLSRRIIMTARLMNITNINSTIERKSVRDINRHGSKYERDGENLKPSTIISTKNYPTQPVTKIPSQYNFVIAIPTTGRPVLCATLKTIALHSKYVNKEYCNTMKTKIVVMSVEEHKENSFNQDCKRFMRSPCFDFVDSKNLAVTTKISEFKIIDKAHQKQTIDFIKVLQYCKTTYKPKHILLMDDDSFWCKAFANELSRATNINLFSIVHMGQGSSGILFKGSDANDLTDYMMKNRMYSNVDILIYKWAHASKKCRLASKLRWLQHKGLVSSFRTTGNWRDDNLCGQLMPKNRLFLKFPNKFNEFFFSANCYRG